ncbi:hypothetical protein EYB25_010088 [Talaromyces marneffei]|nr:hypothetical protein EYB25_010088 [Talaromyces marneffei]
MKFLPSLVVLGLSTQALASSYVDYVTKDQHGLTVYEMVINIINTTTSDFNTRIQSYQGGDLSSILEGCNQVTQIMKLGAEILDQQTTKPLTNNEWLSLLSHMEKKGGLEDMLKMAINTLILKKSLILDSGLGSKLGLALYSQQMASIDLGAKFFEKTPPGKVEDFREHWFKNIMWVIGRGVDTFDKSTHHATIPTLPPRGAMATSNSPAIPTFTDAASAN